jgi:hypothetical protein
MTLSETTRSQTRAEPPPAPCSLVLVGAGTPSKVAARLAKAAAPLAAALGLRLVSPLADDDPQTALAGLAAAAQGAASGGELPLLAPLPRDPGHTLPAGGLWAEALGAWRQPVLLLLSAKQLNTGLPASSAALLERWNVPCVGLVQWGGAWEPESRRRDHLPWLGCLSPQAGEQDGRPGPEELRRALALRWLQLEQSAGPAEPAGL